MGFFGFLPTGLLNLAVAIFSKVQWGNIWANLEI